MARLLPDVLLRPGFEPHRQFHQVPRRDRRPPPQLVLVAVEPYVGQPHQQRVDSGVGDGPPDVLPGALVRAAAEGEVGAVAHHVRAQVGADARVDVARRDAEQEAVAGADALAAQFRLLFGEVGEDGAERRLVPQ